MSGNRAGRSRHSFLLNFAKQIISLELIWPLPLIGVGVFGILNPFITSMAIVLALIPWFARWLVFGQPTQRVFFGGAMALFVVSAFASMWATYDPALSWPMLLTLLGSVSLFFAIANTDVPPEKIGGGLVTVTSLVALYFVGQYAHFSYGETGQLAYLGWMTGLLLPDLVFFTPHPNAVAGFLEGTLLLSLILTRQAGGGKRLLGGLATVIIAHGLLISGSRGSWIGLVVAIGIWVVLSIPNRTLRLVIGGVIGVGALLGFYATVHLMLSDRPLFFISSAQNTTNSRLTLYQNSLYLLGDYPFSGIGLGDTFAMVYSRYQLMIHVPFLTYPHNLLLSVGLGLGILGLVALAWLLIGFYRFVFQVEGNDLNTGSLSLFRATWLGITTTFIHGLTDSPQFAGSGWTMPMLFALLGMAVVVGRPALMQANAASVIPIPGRRLQYWWWARAVVIVVTLLIVVVVFWRPLASAWYTNIGAIYHTRADLSPNLSDTEREAAGVRATTYFLTAINFNPAQPAANRRLGMLALSREDFDAAVIYLEQAYRVEPENRATRKALGYAYLWTGQLNTAEALLQQLGRRGELINELGVWRGWWPSQERSDLSRYADEMIRRLSPE